MRDAKTERLRELIEELVGEAVPDAQGVQDIWKEETLQTMSLFIEHEETTNLRSDHRQRQLDYRRVNW